MNRTIMLACFAGIFVIFVIIVIAVLVHRSREQDTDDVGLPSALDLGLVYPDPVEFKPVAWDADPFVESDDEKDDEEVEDEEEEDGEEEEVKEGGNGEVAVDIKQTPESKDDEIRESSN